ncbi:MAG: hypothetical protein QXW47_01790 [Candidatus Jordarchaeales archaeon]|nr:hypothetical protein [Candidatus Jordarchaeia archaeon]
MEKMREKEEKREKEVEEKREHSHSIEDATRKPLLVDELEHVMQRISEAEALLLGVPAKPIMVLRPPPIPEWSVKSPWMFTKPKEERFLKSWREEWAKYVLEWAEALLIHLIGVNEMLSRDLFKNLSIDDLVDILDYMCLKNWCKWWDKKKTLIRIYWKSLEEWKEVIWSWAVSQGLEYISVMDLANVKEAFSTIPREELEFLLNNLVKEKRAVWADKKTKTIKLIFT